MPILYPWSPGLPPGYSAEECLIQANLRINSLSLELEALTRLTATAKDPNQAEHLAKAVAALSRALRLVQGLQDVKPVEPRPTSSTTPAQPTHTSEAP